MGERGAAGAPAVPERIRPARICGVILAVCVAGCEKGPPPDAAPDLELGQAKFRMFCSPCHGSEGQGTQNGPPPLAGSPWVMGPETRLIRIILHGVRGAIEVHQKTYNLERGTGAASGPHGVLERGGVAPVRIVTDGTRRRRRIGH
jgi:mono/diheme cytochrome c family protein